MSVDQIMAWLDSKGVTLWGTFDLSQPERKLQGAIWFLTQMQELGEFQRTVPVGENWDVVQ